MASRTERSDVIVVGGGATGGWAAKLLCEAGASVCLVEAGRVVSPDELAPFPGPTSTSDSLQFRYGGSGRQRVQRLAPLYNRATRHFFVDDDDFPYATAKDTSFTWIRGRQLGGRTYAWGSGAPRFPEALLQAAGGAGNESWPLTQTDLAPHYDAVERFMGVHGQADGLPQMPDGHFLPPRGMNPREEQAVAALNAQWQKEGFSHRRAIHPRVMSAVFSLEGPRSVCAARATGRLTLISEAPVQELLCHPESGKLRGVAYVKNGERHEREARAVILCASTLESTRLLLGSGLANSSGLLGRHLMDHTAVVVSGVFHDAPFDPFRPQTLSFDHSDANGFWIPPFQHREAPGNFDGRDFIVCGAIGRRGGSYLKTLMVAAKHKVAPAFLYSFGNGESLPLNHVSLSDQRDITGARTLTVSCQWSERDLALQQAQLREMRDIARRIGMEVVEEHVGEPGSAVHEVGTARMGTRPETSVLDSHCRAWDVPNLYVSDGAGFPSSVCLHPTLTMMALTGRACAHVLGALARRDL